MDMKAIFTLGLFLVVGMTSWAQPPRSAEQKAKVKELRVEVYTRILELTEDEADAFWPVHEAYEAELEKVRKRRDELAGEIRRGIDDLSDEELEKKMDEMVSLRTKEAELFEAYYQNVKKVLPLRKVVRLHRAEREFKRELLRMYRRERPR